MGVYELLASAPTWVLVGAGVVTTAVMVCLWRTVGRLEERLRRVRLQKSEIELEFGE